MSSTAILKPRSELFRQNRVRRVLYIVGVLLILVGLALRFRIAVNRGYQVDEIEHIHVAYNFVDGRVPYRDFWEGHTPLLHLLLSSLVRIDSPQVTFQLARLLLFLVSVANCWLIYSIGSIVFSRQVGLLAFLLLSFHTTFSERGIEVRPDVWMAFCTLLALRWEIKDEYRLKNSIYSSLAVSFSVLFTQKSLFPSLLIGAIWIFKAFKRKSLTPVVVPAAVFFIPILLSFVLFMALGALQEYWHHAWLTPFGVFSRSETRDYSFTPFRYLFHESKRNYVFVAFAAAGYLMLPQALKQIRGAPWTRFGFLLAAVLLPASLFLNPFPFPYFHVPVLPIVALISAWALVQIGAVLWRKSVLWLVGYSVSLLLLVFQGALPRLLLKGDDSKSRQMLMLQEVQRVTEKNDAVFDLVGLYFRPDAYFTYVMTYAMTNRYKDGQYPRIVPELRRNEAVAMMLNYRMRLLPRYEIEFLKSHFVHFYGDIFVQGCFLQNLAEGKTSEFEVLKAKEFVFIGPAKSLEVDGIPFERGRLTRGVHLLKARRLIDRGVLIMNPPGAVHPYFPPGDTYVNFD